MTLPSEPAVNVEISISYVPERGHIAIGIPGQELTTINDDPASVRGNPSLFAKLGCKLRDAGAPHPTWL